MTKPWEGPLPTTWRRQPFWTEFQRAKTLGDGTDELLSVYRDYGVIPKASRDDNFNKPSEDLSKYQLVETGDLVINKMKAWQGSLGVSAYSGIVSPAYFVYKAVGSLDRRFAHYLLRSGGYAQHMAAISSGIRPNQWDLDPLQLSSTPLLVPPAGEQRAIADFLDRETAQIDAFIAKNEELIALLIERRVAAITTAIATAGSTSAWVALRFIATVLDCKHVTAEPTEGDESFSVASVREVAGKWVDVTNARRTSRDSFVNLGEGGRQLRAWDLVVCRNASVGKVSLVPPGIEPTVLGQDVSLIRVADANPGIARFVYYALTSAIGVDAFEQASIGSTFRRINVDDIKSLRLPTVNGEEGGAIADSLDAITGRIDSAIGTAQRSIDLARERRAALISAAVTGKIDLGVSA